MIETSMRPRPDPRLPGVRANAQPDNLYSTWTARGTNECLGSTH